jgi:hypothetical protein
MRGCFLTKIVLFLIIISSSIVSILGLALTGDLNAVIHYAVIHHPSIQHAKLDLDQIDYDVKVESDRFNPKLFWHTEAFYEKESCYESQGTTLGSLMHWDFSTGTKIMGNIGTDLAQNKHDISKAGIRIKQPLIKNAGKKVNQNSLIQAQIQKDILLVNYQKTLEALILQVSNSYFNYIEIALVDKIQKDGLEQAKKYLYQVKYLIDTGRLAKNEAEQPALHVEDQENKLEESQQRLAFNYLLLMQSMGVLDEREWIKKSAVENNHDKIKEEIENLLTRFKKYYAQTIVAEFVPVDKQEKLLEYQYKMLEQNKWMAKNETKWNMNIEGYASAKEHDNQYGVNFSLDFPINDKLKQYQSLYHLNIDQTKLNDEHTMHGFYYPKKIAFEKQEIESKFKQLAFSQKMKDLSEKSLKTAELKWQTGRVSLFELIQLSNQYQQSELDLVKVKMSLLNTGFVYLKSIGVLEKFWIS